MIVTHPGLFSYFFFLFETYGHTVELYLYNDRKRIWTEALCLSNPFPRWQILTLVSTWQKSGIAAVSWNSIMLDNSEWPVG